MSNTPRTDKLLADELDSNDVRAWVDLCRQLEFELKGINDILTSYRGTYTREKERADRAEADAAFYRSCALSGEVPKPGAEPSAKAPHERVDLDAVVGTGHFTDTEIASIIAELRRSRARWQSAEALAVFFHDTYERLAPSFGYETRPETRAFDRESANGRLMIAVCAAAIEEERKQRNDTDA